MALVKGDCRRCSRPKICHGDTGSWLDGICGHYSPFEGVPEVSFDTVLEKLGKINFLKNDTRS